MSVICDIRTLYFRFQTFTVFKRIILSGYVFFVWKWGPDVCTKLGWIALFGIRFMAKSKLCSLYLETNQILIHQNEMDCKPNHYANSWIIWHDLVKINWKVKFYLFLISFNDPKRLINQMFKVLFLSKKVKYKLNPVKMF